jgi:hypothetical protein
MDSDFERPEPMDRDPLTEGWKPEKESNDNGD